MVRKCDLESQLDEVNLTIEETSKMIVILENRAHPTASDLQNLSSLKSLKQRLERQKSKLNAALWEIS